MARTVTTRSVLLAGTTRESVQRGFQGISGINYKGILGDVNNSKNYVDIPTLTVNPTSTDWSLFLEYFPPANIHTANWYNITLYSQNNGTGTGRSWLTLPLAEIQRGKITTALGGAAGRSSGIKCLENQRNTVVLYYIKTSQTLGFIVNGVQANTFPSVSVESATGAHRIGATKDDPVQGNGVRCFPGIIGRVQLYSGRNLTVAEALNLHNGNMDKVSLTGLILNYKMQQNSGTVIDSSGQENHGTIKIYTPPTGNEAEWSNGYVVPTRSLA